MVKQTVFQLKKRLTVSLDFGKHIEQLGALSKASFNLVLICNEVAPKYAKSKIMTSPLVFRTQDIS